MYDLIFPFFSIYLVDHAWTFRPNQVRSHLGSIPGLLKRMCALMNVPFDDETDSQTAVNDVMKEMWKYSQTYSIGKSWVLYFIIPAFLKLF